MSKNKVVFFIPLILIIILTLFILNRLLSNRKSQQISTHISIQSQEIKVKPSSVKTAFEIKKVSPSLKKTITFGGNRGYLIKDGKSTYTRFSVSNR